MMMAGGGGLRTKEDKVFQWGQQETRELISICADFERDFTVVRRNKILWEAVSLRMRDKGYSRSPDQCKFKWKNLVNRYKDKESGEGENGRHCPFFEELNFVFTEHPGMQCLLLESEAGTPRSKKNHKRLIGERLLYNEVSDDDEGEDENSDDELPNQSKKRKAEKGFQQQQQQNKAGGGVGGAGKSRTGNSIHEVLQEFMQKQQEMESHWWERIERRAVERGRFEQEWRQSMEKLERERLMLERAWREREEQRRMREECRAEKRDALFTALLNKLIQNGL